MSRWQFRPSKHIQRLMLMDMLRAVTPHLGIKQYVGFGGYEFVDFELAYKHLGIRRLTSIEQRDDIDRFRFNAPYPDIAILHGSAASELQNVDWSMPTIVWLDYCSRLRSQELQDLTLVVGRVPAGSAIFVSVNAEPGDRADARLDQFRSRVTGRRVPMWVQDDRSLRGWGLAAAQRDTMLAEALDAIGAGNEFIQVFDTQYRDTSRMQTWGGFVLERGSSGELLGRLAPFRHVRLVGATPLQIRVPELTAREVLHLEGRLPHIGPAPILPWLKPAEIEDFAELHHWYPPVPAPI